MPLYSLFRRVPERLKKGFIDLTGKVTTYFLHAFLAKLSNICRGAAVKYIA